MPLYIPASSSWFNFDNIHEIEIKSLPEFFCGKYPSKTPETYKGYRNFIINLYRENQNSYLTATVCRRHLAGDACSILRVHAFLEHWGLINFKVDPMIKPTNPFLPKAFNFKSPIYVDASTFLVKEGNNNSTKMGNNNVILTNKAGEEIRTLFPINNHPESLFRSFFNKNNTVLNQVNFLTKNYRPKCDLCEELCELDWYITNKTNGKKPFDFNDNSSENQIPSILSNSNEDNILLICENCYEKKEFPNPLTKDDFELSNVFNILMPNEKFHTKLKERLENEKWTEEETKKLLDAIDTYDDNWDEIAKVFEGKRSKSDCIIHLMQLPIKENVSFKVTDLNVGTTDVKKPKEEINAVTDQNNPLIGQVIFFAKMFEKYIEDDKKTEKKPEEENEDLSSTDHLKEVIYKTYAKSIDVSKNLKNDEKNEMRKIMNLLVHIQMKKIELKLNYFEDFEKMIQFQSQQLKTMESQVFQDRIKLAIKKNEFLGISQKLKEQQKQQSNEMLDKIGEIKIENEPRVLNLINNVTDEPKENPSSNTNDVVMADKTETSKPNEKIEAINNNNPNVPASSNKGTNV